MTLEAQLLTDTSVRAVAGGCEVDVRLPWYRSLPMSCFESAALTVNGEQVSPDDVRVRYTDSTTGEHESGFVELAERTQDWWFVQDAVTLSAPLTSQISAGDSVEVDVTLMTRIPYIMIGPDMALPQQTRVTRKVVAR